MSGTNRSEEIAAADANLLLIETLLDDLWEARQLVGRLDSFLRVMNDQDDEARAVAERLLRIQIAAWRES